MPPGSERSIDPMPSHRHIPRPATAPEWSFNRCCFEIPVSCCKVCTKTICCFDNFLQVCELIHCYDVFDGHEDYNLTSCRENTYRGHYCCEEYDKNSLQDRFCGCMMGPCWLWPVMMANCFNLSVIKNIDRCCLCAQKKCCCHNQFQKEPEQLGEWIWKTGEWIWISRVSRISREVNENQDSSLDRDNYAVQPPPEDGQIPPPYPDTKTTFV